MQDFNKLHTSLLRLKDDGNSLLLLAVIIVLGIGLRLAFLGQPIRYDEAFTYNTFAAHGVREILTNYGQPNNHILHSLLVYFSTSLFGNHPWAIRLPAFIAGVLVIPATYLAARIYYNKQSALLGAALVATSSSLIEYSTNARGYEIICLFTLILVILAKYIKTENNYTAWIIFTIVAVFGLFTIPVMLYPYGGLLCWLGLSWLVMDFYAPERASFPKAILLSTVIVGITTVLLYLPVILGSGLDKLISNQFVRPESWSQGIATFWELLAAIWGHWNTDIPLFAWLILFLGFIISVGFHWKLSSDRIPLALVLMGWCIVLMLITRRVPPWTRVFLFMLPLYLIWSSAGLMYLVLRITLWRKYVTAPIFGGIVIALMLVLGLNLLRTQSVYNSEQTGTLRDAREIADWLGEHLQEGDAVIAFAPSDAVLQYYFDQENVDVRMYSEIGAAPDFKRAFIVTNTTNHQSVEYILEKVGFLDVIDISRAKLVRSYPSAEIIEIQ